MKLRRVISSLVVAVMVLSLIGCSSGNTALFINTKAGDSYKYHIVMNQVFDTEVVKHKMSVKQDMTTDYVLTVESADTKGNMLVDYKYDSLKIENDLDGVKETYDSKNKSKTDHILSKMYDVTIGKGFKAKMSKYGKVSELTGINELLNSMLDIVYKERSDNSSTVMREQIKANLEDSFGDDTLKTIIQQSTKIFPNKKVKIGDSWTIDGSTAVKTDARININTLVYIDITTTYTLEKVEGEIAYLKVNSDFNADSVEPPDNMGIPVTYDLNGKMTGNIKVNVKNGFLSDGEINQVIEGKTIITPIDEDDKNKMPGKPFNHTSNISFTTTKM